MLKQVTHIKSLISVSVVSSDLQLIAPGLRESMRLMNCDYQDLTKWEASCQKFNDHLSVDCVDFLLFVNTTKITSNKFFRLIVCSNIIIIPKTQAMR